MQKKLLILVVVALVLVGGVFLVWEREVEHDVLRNNMNGIDDSKDEVIAKADWKVYKNNKLGFEFQYPSTWEVVENEIEADSSGTHIQWTFRYISLKSDEFMVNIGIKNINEGENIKPHDARTGIPAGSFERGERVKIAQGEAEKRYLVYRDGNEPSTRKIQLIFFCHPGEDLSGACNSFSIGENKTGFVSIDTKGELGTENWDNIEKEVDAVLSTLIVE